MQRRYSDRMVRKRRVEALDTPALLRILKVAPSTLNYWVDKGFCHPTLKVGSGQRATRYWTVQDLVVLRAIKELRAAGCSLQLIATVERRLRTSFDLGLSNAVLYYNGKDVLVEDQGAIVSLIAEAGQAVFAEIVQLVAFPLRPWVEAGKQEAKLVDIAAIRERREKIRAKRSA